MKQNKFDVAVRALNKVCDLCLGIAIVAMMVVLLFQIISRFVAFIPLPWSQDFLTFLLVCSVFLGACSATADGKQIRLEFFVDLFPQKVRKIIYSVADVVSIVFLVKVSLDAFALGGENMRVLTGACPIPVGMYYMVLGVGLIAMAINFLNLIINRIITSINQKATYKKNKEYGEK